MNLLPNAIRVALLFLLITTGLAHSQVPANPFDYSRTKSFTYKPNGWLETETVESTANAPTCSVTTFGYDAQGNRTSQTTANCLGATANAVFESRIQTFEFPAVASQAITVNGATTPNATVPVIAGVFPTIAKVATGLPIQQTETREYDPRFGVATKATARDGLVGTALLDLFGRKIKETGPDGTSTIYRYCYLSGAGMSSNSTSCPTPAIGEAPADAVFLVHQESRTTRDVKVGPFVRVYSDRLGRTIRTVTESFDGANQPAAYRGALVVQDVVYNIYGAKVLETAPYFLSAGSSTTAGANDVKVVMTTYDTLGRTIGVFTTDPTATGGNRTQTLGASGAVGYRSYGTRVGAWTTITYKGLTTVVTNDKENTRTEERNANGDIARVTDDNGAQLSFLRDAFGNVVQTRDALQNNIHSTYDIRGNKRSTNDPDKGLWNFDYNAIGEAVSQDSPNQRAVAAKTTMQYDALGRLTLRVEPEFESRWYFDKYADGSACNRGTGRLCESRTTHGANKKYVYDNFGRATSMRTDMPAAAKSFAVSQSYEAATGRLSTYTYPTGLQLGYNYSSGGFAESVKLNSPATLTPRPNAQGQAAASTTLAAGSLLWQAQTLGAEGQVEREWLGNTVIQRVGYEAGTGRVSDLFAGIAGATNLLNQHYTWSSIGNLASRIDHNGDGSNAVSENFLYDYLNRLVQYQVSGTGMPSPFVRTVTMQYNALGMMQNKSDVGTYTYGTMGSAQPHALRSVTGPIGNITYTRDANGNITGASAGKYRTLGYTSFDLPDGATGIGGPAGSPKYTWQYDERHARIMQTQVAGGNTRTLWYLHPDLVGGLAFESESNTSPVSSNHRHFVAVGGRTIGVLVSDGALPTLAASQTAPTPVLPGLGGGGPGVSLTKVEYWHKDHLGSIAATSDHLGALTQRYSYDPFGKRRLPSGAYDADGNVKADWNPAVNHGTGRGFTGHEELDDVGLVHMNGRVYDDTLGLFLQGDPVISEPLNLQNYNRYSYALNNPLNKIDPSGFDVQTLDAVTITGRAGEFNVDVKVSGTYNTVADTGRPAIGWAVQITYKKTAFTTVAVAPESKEGVRDYRRAQSTIAIGRTEGEIEQARVRNKELLLDFVPGSGLKDGAEQVRAATGPGDIAVGLALITTELPGLKQAKAATKGEAGRFADLVARGVKGDKLTPHHMPQAAAGFTSRADGGALMMPEAEHTLTRTYGFKGALTAKQEAGMAFRDVLARDIRNVRGIGGSQYNQGLRDLLDYYRTNFPELMMKK